MAHTIYDNFYLSNEVEDQYNSHLDLQQFCTVDNSLLISLISTIFLYLLFSC